MPITGAKGHIPRNPIGPAKVGDRADFVARQSVCSPARLNLLQNLVGQIQGPIGVVERDGGLGAGYSGRTICL